MANGSREKPTGEIWSVVPVIIYCHGLRSRIRDTRSKKGACLMPAVCTFIGLKEFAANQAKIQCFRKQKAFVFFSFTLWWYRFTDSLVGGYATTRNGCGEQEPPVVGDWTEWEGCSGECSWQQDDQMLGWGFWSARKEKVFVFFGIFENLKQENLRFTTQLLISCRVT